VTDPALSARISAEILARCESLGFALVGICSAAPSTQSDNFTRWLAEGKHGSMDYLTEHVPVRLDVRRLMATSKYEQGDTRSIIMVADQYATRNTADDAPLTPGQGRIARYARGKNYHDVIKRRLHTLADELRLRYPGSKFCSFVDTAPVLERELAARVGMGWIGKHTLLIHPRRGSYLLLGGIATSLELAEARVRRAGENPTAPALEALSLEPDRCGTCTRCIDACPTKAISPYSVDASRCISYLTIERRLPIAPEFHQPIGDWIAGCDICQEVCPHNSPRLATPGKPPHSPPVTPTASALQSRARGPGGTGVPPVPNGPEFTHTQDASAAENAIARAENARQQHLGEVHPDYAPRTDSFPALDVLNWTEEDRRRAFMQSPLKRISLPMIRRNAIIVLANDPITRQNPEIQALLHQIAADPREDDVVRSTAQQTLNRLNPPESPAPAATH
jgi:epoxyqueuosine reductase